MSQVREMEYERDQIKRLVNMAATLLNEAYVIAVNGTSTSAHVDDAISKLTTLTYRVAMHMDAPEQMSRLARAVRIAHNTPLAR